ncbi:MAG: nickel pincer cofactor biosynthesis protein LarB [Myxococcota bacterium]
MDSNRLKDLLESVRTGEVGVDGAVDQLSQLPYLDTGQARIDTHRAVRQGIPEVIYGESKTAEQIIDGARALRGVGQEVLATRVSAEKATAICAALPESCYDEASRVLYLGAEEVPVQGKGTILIVSAGSADFPVAAEAQKVAQRFGNKVELLQDVGVAGLHRLLASLDLLRSARVLIVVAGMEGALPSVVGGLVDKPVIAVPTSVGYGVAMGGMAALMGMLTSCASNVTTVNIDNGFGAAHVATLINRL